MKKLIYCALALAAGLFATSCQQENLEPVAQENTVTYTVEVPGVATKAYGEGQEVNQLIYEVWKTDETGEINSNAVRLYQVNDKELQLVDKVRRAQITLNLVKDQTYRILLWAQVKKEAGFENYNTENLTRVSYKYNVASAYSANQEQYDAFYATKVISTFTAPKPEKISLKRPFAQLNIATENNVTDYTVAMNTSKVVVEGVPTVFNVATSEASALTTVTFNTFNVPEGTVTVTTDAQSKSYDYAAMNYVFASKSGINAKVSYDINSTLTSKNLDGSNGVETEAKVSNIIPNVPLKENYRTNIVGNLLSSSTKYEIVVDAEFGPDGNGDMFVINDGLIKNINGDYEVTNENGLEYAIENLFAQGGNFYLTAALYDMTDYDVTSPSVPEGVVLNIYGETPVVTRSATVAGVTIIGLKGSMIETNDGTVSFSGIKVEGTDENPETPAFIETNNGSADFTGCETTTQDYIGENTGTVTESDNTVGEDKTLVAEDNGETLKKVATADELVAALEAKMDVLFMKDIKIDPASMSNAYGATGINVKYGQTIDGNGYTLNIQGAGGTWDSGINTTGGIIKNLTVTGSFRGIFINHTSDHSEKVVLENVTIGGNGTVYTISCDQGLNQGIEATKCTFNGWTSFAATAGEAKFINCSFGEGSDYKYCRPYSNTEFVNCTFCPGYVVDTTRAIVTFTDCTAKVASADDLVAALEAGIDVLFLNDIKIDPASMSNAYGTTGINVTKGQTIDGNGYTLNIKGAGGTWDSGINTTGGLIKNLTVTGSFRGIFINHNSTHSEPVVLENVTLEGVVYTISCDQGLNQNLEATNCEFYGWTSYAATIGNVKFTDCTFGAGSGYNFSRPYAPTQYVNCEFEAGHQIDARAAVTFTNCTFDGVAITDGNIADLVTGNSANAGVDAVVKTADELVAALEANKNVFFANDIKIEPANMSNAYGKTGINVKNGQTIDGNSYTLNIKGAGGTWDSGINTTGGLIKNITVTGSFRGIFINHNSDHSETVVLDNVTIEGTTYTISCDQGVNQNLEATNSTFRGWTSYAATIGNVKFTDCTFGAGNGYNFSRPYAPTQYVNCEFEAGHQIDPRAAVTFKNCTLDGVALTTENLSVLVTSRISNATLVTDNGLVRFANAAITNPAGVRYEGDVFENPIEDALYFNNYIFGGNATINVTRTYGAIILENCKADINGDLITIDNDNNSVMVLQNLDLTLAEGKKLIKSKNTIYQVFMENITINGVKMTDENVGQYLENVAWFQVVEEI